MYSLGVILYQWIFGTYPYVDYNPYLILEKIKSGPPKFTIPGVMASDETIDLITKMLQYDPEKRITWPELFDHPFIRGTVESDISNK